MIRCTIYTRKSFEEGLEQDFNSLDAQREACDAYIKSQVHEGWVLVDKQYNDGGYSGGTMECPAFKELLKDIENNEIDIVDNLNDKIINEESKTGEIITADDLINDSINDSLGNNLNENDLNQLSILNSSEVNDSNNATGNEDIKLKEDKQQIEPVTIDSLPVVDNNDLEVNITDLNDNEKKLKVINVERLNDNTSDETLENNEFLIGNYIS